LGKKTVIGIMEEANEVKKKFKSKHVWNEWWKENLRQQLHLEF
jgi:hypothetical protein